MVRFKRVVKYGNGELWMVFSSLGLEFLVQQDKKLVFASESPFDYSNEDAVAMMLDSLKAKYRLTFFDSDVLVVTVMKNGTTYGFRIMGDEEMIHIMCGYGDSYLRKSLFAYGSYYNLPAILNLCVGLTP